MEPSFPVISQYIYRRKFKKSTVSFSQNCAALTHTARMCVTAHGNTHSKLKHTRAHTHANPCCKFLKYNMYKEYFNVEYWYTVSGFLPMASTTTRAATMENFMAADGQYEPGGVKMYF